jgi:hypothetical protein
MEHQSGSKAAICYMCSSGALQFYCTTLTLSTFLANFLFLTKAKSTERVNAFLPCYAYVVFK